MEPCFSSKTLLSIGVWVHEHTAQIKISRIAFDLLGASLMGTSFIATSLPLFASGACIILITEIAYFSLSFFGFIAVDRTNHIFTETTRGLSRIYYQGNTPVLETRQLDPFEAGREHGYLMAPHIFLTRTRICMRLLGIFHLSEIEQSLPQIRERIPQNYLRELEGIVEGMNEWDREHSFFFSSHITLNELLLFHLVPDMAHLTLSYLPLMGCSVLIDGPVIGRHLDWPSFGVFGQHTILVHRVLQQTLSIGIPGLVGDLTNINHHGLFLALNVCSPRERVDHVREHRIPSIFLIRQLSETYTSVNNLQNSTLPSPLVPFHLNAIDPTSAVAIHFRQHENSSSQNVLRTLEHQSPLTTFNNHHPTTTTETHHLFLASERAEAVRSHFESHLNDTPLERIQGALRKSPINCPITIHHIIYNTETRELHLSFDNGYAALQPEEVLSLNTFFSR